MASSLAGLLTLAYAPNFTILLIGGILLGLGSAIFHPEASRIARLASGGRHGLAQSIRHRVESRGGTVRVRSTLGRGTEIGIEMPLEGE